MATDICPCIDQGLTNLQNILITGLSTVFGSDFNKLQRLWTTIKCNFPKDIEVRVSGYITRITNESSQAVSTVNLLYVIIIFFTLFILIILIFLTIYYKNDTYTIAFGILSGIIVIAAALILLLTTAGTYTNANNNVQLYLTQLNDVLLEIRYAIDQGLCCIGGCKTCKCIFPILGTCYNCNL
jgi:cytochrome c biogenesis protein CcdA